MADRFVKIDAWTAGGAANQLALGLKFRRTKGNQTDEGNCQHTRPTRASYKPLILLCLSKLAAIETVKSQDDAGCEVQRDRLSAPTTQEG